MSNNQQSPPPPTKFISIDLKPPHQVRVNGVVMATHDTLEDAMAHYDQLLVLVRET